MYKINHENTSQSFILIENYGSPYSFPYVCESIWTYQGMSMGSSYLFLLLLLPVAITSISFNSVTIHLVVKIEVCLVVAVNVHLGREEEKEQILDVTFLVRRK